MSGHSFAAAALPSRNQTLLLRTCLCFSGAARASWEEWLRGTSRPGDRLRDSRGGFKRLVPLLGYQLRQQGIHVDPELASHLRAARVREQLRAESVRDLCRLILTPLAAQSIPAVVLRGVMAAHTLYASPGLRHCHDLDLLIAPEHLDAAARVLKTERYSMVTPRVWRHESGFPVMLHHTLFRIAAFNRNLGDITLNTVSATIAGAPATLLSPEANLVHLCGHASTTGSQVTPNWAADAWLLLHRHPEIQWRQVIEWASRGTLALALSVTLGYLAAELDAPIPPAVLDAVKDAARRQPRRAAWFAALRSVEGRPLALLRSSRGLDRYRAFTYLARRAAGLLEVS
jgi:hypothetical protein